MIKMISTEIVITDFRFDRYRLKRPKVDSSFFDSAMSHTRRSDASEKGEGNTRDHFWPNSPVDQQNLDDERFCQRA